MLIIFVNFILVFITKKVKKEVNVKENVKNVTYYLTINKNLYDEKVKT